MAVFRVNKNSDYTCMSNTHLRDKRMSLRAKGLLSIILSLPDTWDYSKKGLLALINEGEYMLDGALQELKEYGYMRIEKVMPTAENPRLSYVYNIYETPQQDPNLQPLVTQGLVEQALVEQALENHPLYKIRNKSNTKELNTKDKKTFIPPTLEEVTAYCKERHNDIDPQRFIAYYAADNWHDSEGKPVRNWKQRIITWEGKRKNGGKTDSGTPDKATRKFSYGETI